MVDGKEDWTWVLAFFSAALQFCDLESSHHFLSFFVNLQKRDHPLSYLPSVIAVWITSDSLGGNALKSLKSFIIVRMRKK